ncbi:MAG: hypothetical protein J6C03_00295 [Clostridia bacterium]|nr:hypothetical protein [Clostridia bacterium]
MKLLRNLSSNTKIISIVFSTILLISVILTLLFGTGEDKFTVIILSLALPVIVYFFIYFTFRIVSKNASAKFMSFAISFFLICGILGILIDLVGFVSAFPNGLNPSMTCCMSLILAVLNETKKI